MKHFLLSITHSELSLMGLISLDDWEVALLKERRKQHWQADEDLAGLLYLDLIPQFFEDLSAAVSSTDFDRFEQEGWLELLTRPLNTGEAAALDGEHLVLSKEGIYWFGFSPDIDSNGFFETTIIPYDKLFGRET